VSLFKDITVNTLCDLVNNMESDSKKCKVQKATKGNHHSAYLGPLVWNKHLSLQKLDEDEFSVMNIEEFLKENNIHLHTHTSTVQSRPDSESSCSSPEWEESQSAKPNHYPNSQSSCISPIRQLSCTQSSRYNKLENSKNLDVDVDIKFSPKDLALATVPGVDFDPREKTFAIEDLKPQPIIRKRPKIYVSNDSKDIRYWEKRSKNNMAARRSREARRLKENQIALRAAYLEHENNQLKMDLQDSKFYCSKLHIERDILKQKLFVHEDLFRR